MIRFTAASACALSWIHYRSDGRSGARRARVAGRAGAAAWPGALAGAGRADARGRREPAEPVEPARRSDPARGRPSADAGAALSDLAFLSAAELGRRIARGDLSPVEVIEDQLARIDRIDPQLNSYVMVLAERARAEARAAEAEIAASGGRGPLHGVPIALKDILDTAGLETTAG